MTDAAIALEARQAGADVGRAPSVDAACLLWVSTGMCASLAVINGAVRLCKEARVAITPVPAFIGSSKTILRTGSRVPRQTHRYLLHVSIRQV